MRTANLKEWIGRTDDSKPPPSVRLRIFQTHKGICHISKRKIMPGEAWEAEHIIAISLGGQNRESNMAPALVKPHKAKTADDRAKKAKDDAVRMTNLGIPKRKGQPMPGTRASGWKRKMNGTVERRP